MLALCRPGEDRASTTTRPRVTLPWRLTDAYKASPAAVQIRDAISVNTFSWSVIEIPGFPCSVPGRPSLADVKDVPRTNGQACPETTHRHLHPECTSGTPRLHVPWLDNLIVNKRKADHSRGTGRRRDRH
jgi:hypothetical protein